MKIRSKFMNECLLLIESIKFIWVKQTNLIASIIFYFEFTSNTCQIIVSKSFDYFVAYSFNEPHNFRHISECSDWGKKR